MPSHLEKGDNDFTHPNYNLQWTSVVNYAILFTKQQLDKTLKVNSRKSPHKIECFDSSGCLTSDKYYPNFCKLLTRKIERHCL